MPEPTAATNISRSDPWGFSFGSIRIPRGPLARALRLALCGNNIQYNDSTYIWHYSSRMLRDSSQARGHFRVSLEEIAVFRLLRNVANWPRTSELLIRIILTRTSSWQTCLFFRPQQPQGFLFPSGARVMASELCCGFPATRGYVPRPLRRYFLSPRSSFPESDFIAPSRTRRAAIMDRSR
jgi:hypothetical protein